MCLAQAIAPSTPRTQPQATISSGAGAHIIPAPAGYRFPDNQTYVFSVEWHLFTAGTASVKLEDIGRHQRVAAIAHSTGFVNTLFKVNDTFEAQFDPHTFCSLQVQKHSEEGSHKRDTQITFDYTRNKSILDERNLKTGEIKHVENDIPGCITDVISGFYYLASLPLQPGNIYTFPLNDGGKTADVRAQVEAREQIKVPAGTFQTVRLSGEAISGPLKGKGSVAVWFTEDSNHTPVQMRSKLGWGTLLFKLQRIER